MHSVWSSRGLSAFIVFAYLGRTNEKNLLHYFQLFNLVVTLTTSTHFCSYSAFFTISNSSIQIIVYSQVCSNIQNDSTVICMSSHLYLFVFIVFRIVLLLNVSFYKFICRHAIVLLLIISLRFSLT